jgi:sulfatase maturation enzyme AslB (radical SAM superfamily)
MADQRIFCAVPWHNTHIYWDGNYGNCCYEAHAPKDAQNLKTSSIINWYNSNSMQDFRKRILGNEFLSECRFCYQQEQQGHESRRVKENFKTGIFTEQAFDRSFEQSPWREHFTEDTNRLPIDWHVDFGNECNLACKMCSPQSSSRIAGHYKTWGFDTPAQINWTDDDDSWRQFLTNINLVDRLHRIHIMGGEPLLSKKFKEFIDFIADYKQSISISFVTNGTLFNDEIIDKLTKFKQIDIEVSLESVHSNNHYIRQGSDTNQVLSNIKKLLSLKNENFNIILRSVPQLLNVNNYFDYILYAFNNRISIQSIPLMQPDYLAINILPWEIRKQLIEKYTLVRQQIAESDVNNFNTITTGRDVSRLENQLVRECNTIINMLQSDSPSDVDTLRYQLIEWLNRWDNVYKLNALNYYPEYKEFLIQYGYKI